MCFHLVFVFWTWILQVESEYIFIHIAIFLCLLMWHMSSAQMWRWLCNCFKCEHDLNDRAQLWNNYLKFLINFQWWKINQNSICPHIRSKNYTSKKSNSSRVSNNTKRSTQFPENFKFWLNAEFFWLFFFQYSITLVICRSIHYETMWMHTPYSLKAFQQYQEHIKKYRGLGDFQHDKQTNYHPQ